MAIAIDNHTEWLEADGLGGYASGTTSGERTRRYHALLLTATNPPTGRMVLVNGFDAWVETPSGRFAISSQRYAPDVVYPDGAARLVRFEHEPWPTWTYQLPDDSRVVQELFVPQGMSACCLRWKFSRKREAWLKVRPLFSGRDYHATHHENAAFRFEPKGESGWLWWSPYDGVPKIGVFTNAMYSHEPQWYRNFLYLEEKERGLDFVEDLASPGVLQWDLAKEAVLIFAAEGNERAVKPLDSGIGLEPDAAAVWRSLSDAEQNRRAKFESAVERAADAYIVKRGNGQTIIAGYPWFTDWGRDTFISLRGLCLAMGRLETAKNILLAWAGTVDQGMLPNRFPDAGDAPEFNSVDASLWYVVAVHDFLETAARANFAVTEEEQGKLNDAVRAIVAGYSAGTRFGIRQDEDGLLAAGGPERS